MSSCGTCWWADHDPSNPNLHVLFMEDDYLTMKKPGDAPAKLRVIHSCFMGEPYFQTYGTNGQHTCNKWVSFEEKRAQTDEEEDRIRRKWNDPTSRTQLSKSDNLLEHITIMSEGDNAAYDIFMDAMMHDGDALGRLIVHLNDMNIRGEQIPLAYKSVNSDMDAFFKAVKGRSDAMVAYVNKNYAFKHVEKAVVSGAHKYGHAKSAKPASKLKLVR